MFKPILAVLLLWLTLFLSVSTWAAGESWEYRVVILQGVTAGGTIDKQARGIYVDTRKTDTLNEMAAEGWEVVSVVGVPAADHAVYLRRKSGR